MLDEAPGGGAGMYGGGCGEPSGEGCDPSGLGGSAGLDFVKDSSLLEELLLAFEFEKFC